MQLWKLTQVKIDPNDLIQLVIKEVYYCVHDEGTATAESALSAVSRTLKKPPRGRGKPYEGRSDSKDVACHTAAKLDTTEAIAGKPEAGKKGKAQNRRLRKRASQLTMRLRG